MREIKFRGKRLDNGEWVYGYLIGKDVIVGDIVEFNDEYFNTEFWWKVNPETVGQYTGLKDKNGKQIYEGDVLRETYIDNDLASPLYAFYEMAYDKQLCGWFLSALSDNTTNKYFTRVACSDEEEINIDDFPEHKVNRPRSYKNFFEVIGNIYENPEQLKGDGNA